MAHALKKPAGFTLVELLVVIAILGILMGLLLPAVGSVRDSARRAQCENNLAQIGRGCQGHVAKLGFFPSSGWGWEWGGDPDRGFGARQPGGWIYNILPFLGLDMIHDIAKGLPGDFDASTPTSKYNKLMEQQMACVPFLICPVRRKAILYPESNPPYPEWNSAAPSALMKTDYAGNAGSFQGNLGTGPGPNDNCFASFPNCSGWLNSDAALTSSFNGVTYDRSEVQPGHITDGLSNVFLAGEKNLSTARYYDGLDGADNSSAFEGYDWDVNRWVITTPVRDTSGVSAYTQFGAAHAQGTHFVFCDGSVRLISYQIDPSTYTSLGVRNDGTYSENF